MEYPDDRLRLMFTCCHPALEREDQVALTLYTLGGLTAAEIARAFLLPAPMLVQRLERARRQIEEGHIHDEPLNLAERLPSVQAVIISFSTRATWRQPVTSLFGEACVPRRSGSDERFANSCRTKRKAWACWRSCCFKILAVWHVFGINS